MGIKELGTAGVFIRMSDNEGASNALRRRVQALHPGAALDQTPVAHDRESRGVTVRGRNIGEGRAQALLLALTSRGSGWRPCSHPAVALSGACGEPSELGGEVSELVDGFVPNALSGSDSGGDTSDSA